MDLDIILVEPEIPQNTGNIARTCVAIGARLHLVRPLGFSLDNRYVKRAGLDYWSDLDLKVWPDLHRLLEECANGMFARKASIYLATTKGQKAYSDVQYPEHVALFFGKETRGLPIWLLQQYPERCLRIPMRPRKRSLNLSNAVAVMAYEVLRQHDFEDLEPRGPFPEA
jgi:tRNA (cytidine/uridine-2'-O-)-methyltransferase